MATPDAAVVVPPVSVYLPVLLDAQQAEVLLVEDEEDRPAGVVGLGKDRVAGGPGAGHGSAWVTDWVGQGGGEAVMGISVQNKRSGDEWRRGG